MNGWAPGGTASHSASTGAKAIVRQPWARAAAIAAAAYAAFRSDLELYLDMLGVTPEVIACDMHPDYLSTRWAHERAAGPVEVQHHHAHAAACLAEHGERGPALAVVFDGTGYGPDGTLWGGEVLRCDLREFERLAHLDPVALPGGAAAIHEPWRTAAAYLEMAGRPVPFPGWPELRPVLAVNAPMSSGMGRLFDAEAAVLGVRDRVSYEGQAAIELEQLAGDEAAAASACAAAGDPKLVVLSGGTFQNVRLLRALRRRLEELGFRVLSHTRVPPNDGGISYGQAAVASARGR
jgi:hydrogenase maturation protein HypF